MSDASRAAPSDLTERVPLIDALRGFALFGVLVANLGLFSGWWGMPPAQAEQLATADIDHGFAIGTMIAIHGKSVTLFSFLFGVGFAVYLERSDVRRWIRRIAIMCGIGAVHAFLIWAGDILVVYALGGFAVLAVRGRRDRTLVIWATVLCATAALAPLIRLWFSSLPSPGRMAWAATQAESLSDAFVANSGIWRAYWLTPALVIFLCTVVGRIMLGYLVGRRRLLHDAAAHRRLFRRLLAIGSSIGVLTTGVFVASIVWELRPRGLAAIPFALVAELRTLSLAAAYLAGFTLLYQRPWFRRLVGPLEHVGRMALTNYIAQSVVCTLVFYHVAFGLAGHVHAAASLGIGVGVFALQIVISRIWLARFRFGPVEWLWRSLTYGTRQRWSSTDGRTRTSTV